MSCVVFLLDVESLSLCRLFRTLSVLCLCCPPTNCCRGSWIMWPSDCPILRWVWWRVRNTQSCKLQRENFMTRASLWGKVSLNGLLQSWMKENHACVFGLLVRSKPCCVVFVSAQQESTKKGNMKRENKAYSFKEQIIELELQEVRTTWLMNHLHREGNEMF